MPTKKEIVNSFEYSELIQDIISIKPHFIIRYGLILFLIILSMIAFTCWLIEYPDIVYVKAKLASINSPKEVVSKGKGKIIKLFANENNLVRKGDILGYLESNANHEEVIKLSKYTDSLIQFIQTNKIKEIMPLMKGRYNSIGELQIDYQTFFLVWQTFKNYIENGFYLKKRTMLIKDLDYLKDLHSSLLKEEVLIKKDFDLQSITYNANKSLYENEVISDLDLRNEKSNTINKEIRIPQIKYSIISNEAQQNEKLKEIAELENSISEQKTIFEQALLTLKSKIVDWENRYIFFAPINGIVAYSRLLQEQQEVFINDIICYIIPQNTKYYAEIYIPQTNFGKIRVGQEVRLKFPSYPYQEYGSLNGRIDFISSINTDSGYYAKTSLTNDLSTSFKKKIAYRDGLMAQGEIITKNMRLLERFYLNLIKKIDR